MMGTYAFFLFQIHGVVITPTKETIKISLQTHLVENRMNFNVHVYVIRKLQELHIKDLRNLIDEKIKKEEAQKQTLWNTRSSFQRIR